MFRLYFSTLALVLGLSYRTLDVAAKINCQMHLRFAHRNLSRYLVSSSYSCNVLLYLLNALSIYCILVSWSIWNPCFTFSRSSCILSHFSRYLSLSSRSSKLCLLVLFVLSYIYLIVFSYALYL